MVHCLLSTIKMQEVKNLHGLTIICGFWVFKHVSKRLQDKLSNGGRLDKTQDKHYKKTQKSCSLKRLRPWPWSLWHKFLVHKFLVHRVLEISQHIRGLNHNADDHSWDYDISRSWDPIRSVSLQPWKFTSLQGHTYDWFPYYYLVFKAGLSSLPSFVGTL